MTYPIVDYLSFTVPIPCLMTQWEHADRLNMGNLFDERTSDLLELFAAQSNWRYFQKSGLFNEMIRFDDIGLTYMEGNKCDVSLLQFSGQGCAYLRSANIEENVVSIWGDRISRIDLAIDFVTDAEPEIFARSLRNKRFKTESHEASNTGITWYVGSYKSDRFARIYRYSDRTKRAGTLRLEYQFSGNAAKKVAKDIISKGILVVMEELGALYGWSHPAYALPTTGEKFLSPPRPKTRVGKEVWLYNQVLPSLIKEAQKGNVELLVDLKDKLCAIIDEYISFAKE